MWVFFVSIKNNVYICSMDDLVTLIDNMAGRKQQSRSEIYFTICPFGSFLLFVKEKWLRKYINENNFSNSLMYFLSGKEYKKLPSKNGVYIAELVLNVTKCNHNEDPDEWDEKFWLENIKIKLEYD